MLWLARAVYFLREQRQRFKLEILALGVFFSIAIGVIMLGFIWSLVTEETFIFSYSTLIGLAFFSAALTLLSFPSITVDVAEAAQVGLGCGTVFFKMMADRNGNHAASKHVVLADWWFTTPTVIIQP